jgi:hypothetical protein
MTGFEIAALAALIGGSYMQYQANTDAARRQEEAIRQSLARQAELQKEAEKKAMDTANKFSGEDRVKEQSDIENAISTELMAPVSESQQIRSEQTTTQGNVSNDYSTAKAASTVASLKAAEKLARLLGKTTSANRLRMNEGIGIMDAGQTIDQLSSFSRGQHAADSIGIQVAGRPDAQKIFMGSLLQAAGSAGLAYSGGSTPVYQSNASPTLISETGKAPVFDIGKVGTTNSNAWLAAFARR